MLTKTNLLVLSFLFLLMFCSNALAVDMTVFGLTVGGKLSIAECERTKYGYNYSKTVCFERFSKYVSGVDVYSTEPINNENIVVKFPFSDSPRIVKGSSVSAIILDGKLEGVSFATSGISDADDVLTTLKEKYGKPLSYIPRKVQNRMGASFDAFIAGWTFDNLDVSFFSVMTTLDSGEVIIDTKKGGAWRKKQMEELTKDKRPL